MKKCAVLVVFLLLGLVGCQSQEEMDQKFLSSKPNLDDNQPLGRVVVKRVETDGAIPFLIVETREKKLFRVFLGNCHNRSESISPVLASFVGQELIMTIRSLSYWMSTSYSTYVLVGCIN